MPINAEYVGRRYPPSPPYQVGREKIREFADAIGDPNPAYRDPEAARLLGHPDVIAPPTFAVVVSMRVAQQAVEDPALGVDYRRVVHGEQRFILARPIRAGDELVGSLIIDGVRATRGLEMLSTRVELATTSGEAVGTAYSTLVVRPPG